MKEAKLYTNSFYEAYDSVVSAQKILPFINEVFHPRSVVDIGCGIGTWLKIWEDDLGVTDIQGVEGPYVDSKDLKISNDNILFQDLKEQIKINRKFDLAMSLEVAEHLPESRSESFVRELTELSDVVLFSAAVPGQGGVHHINEQYPEYWASLFQKRGFVVVDFLREKIWKDDEIAWWYRQNILLYVKKDKVDGWGLTKASRDTDIQRLFMVHPAMYAHVWGELKKTRPFIGYIRWKLYLLKKSLLKK